MPIALTVFGVTAERLEPTVCYVLLRTVRGPGDYPEPTLSGDLGVRGLSRANIADTPLELLIWDKIIPAADEVALLGALDEGSLVLPADCPVAVSQTIVGSSFGPLIVDEGFQKASVSGVGLLYRKGLATGTLLRTLKGALEGALKPGATPGALKKLIEKLAAETGMAELFAQQRPIGGVDYLFRASVDGPPDGPLFDVAPDKPDLRTRDPMLRVHVRRHAAPLDQRYQLQVTLGNHDETLRSVLVEIDRGYPEITVSASTHITDISLDVFDEAGDLADRLKGAFAQAFMFSLSARGAVDALPTPFAGAPVSPDLETRVRVHTSTFAGPSSAGRSGGLEVLRGRDKTLTAIIGPVSPRHESFWFQRGADGQVAVIRWIKERIEQPSLVKALLVDPYLGSDALKRVVARQGNETAELVIVASPGDVDPDADAAATPGGGRYRWM